MSGPPEKIDPFKPVQPAIPGVPQRPAEEKKEEPSRQAVPETPPLKPTWQSPAVMAGAGVAALVLLAGSVLAWRAMQPAAPLAPVVLDPSAARPNAGKASATGTPARRSRRPSRRGWGASNRCRLPGPIR
jgi:hypothetical protein